MKLKDLIGLRFGRLVVVQRALNNAKGRARWGCVCDCGRRITTCSTSLVQGLTRSCGCLHIEHTVSLKFSHGLRYKPEYRVWAGMIQRCTNSKHPKYSYYGGRGIKVCSRWRESFQNFWNDLGSRPSAQYTLERRENNGHYCPENCCWATRVQQTRNMRNNRIVAMDGKMHSIAEWAEIKNIPYHTLYMRWYRKVERAS